jgi:hypothetical protein
MFVVASVLLFGYGVIGLLSQDPLWFLSRAEIPDPKRILIRVDGEESTLTASSDGYGSIVAAARKALSAFSIWAPGSAGLSEATLEEFQTQGVVLELYFDEAVDFHLPFNDGQPTALFFPIMGRFEGKGYVFRGKSGKWWAGQLNMSDPQPLIDALSALGYESVTE